MTADIVGIVGVSRLDHMQAWSTLAAAVLGIPALLGLVYLFHSSRRDARALRLQASPFMRVDVGLVGVRASDPFEPPEPYYAQTAAAQDLAPEVPDLDKVIVAIWVSNLQKHPLGVALGIEVSVGIANDKIEVSHSAQVAYVQHHRVVQINIFKVPRHWNFAAAAYTVRYFDLYDREHLHVRGGKSTNAAFGRLECVDNGTPTRPSRSLGREAKRSITQIDPQGGRQWTPNHRRSLQRTGSTRPFVSGSSQPKTTRPPIAL